MGGFKGSAMASALSVCQRDLSRSSPRGRPPLGATNAGYFRGEPRELPRDQPGRPGSLMGTELSGSDMK